MTQDNSKTDNLPPLTAGFIQIDVKLGETELNLAEVRKGLAAFTMQSPGLAVLPELWAAGFDYPRIEEHADCTTELWAARLMTFEAAAASDRGEDLKAQHNRCSMVKLFVSETANRIADRTLQIFGGRGYMRENVAERFFRELRVDRIWEGTSEIQRLIIARNLLKRGLDNM